MVRKISPAGSYPAGPGRALSVCCLGFFEPCSDTPPGPSMGINYLDTPLIPRDTPVTEKRHPSPLPRPRGRHITDLRHIRELRLAVARSSGQLILDRSFTHSDLGCARAR